MQLGMQEPVLQYQDDAKIIGSIGSTDTAKPKKLKSFDVYSSSCPSHAFNLCSAVYIRSNIIQ